MPDITQRPQLRGEGPNNAGSEVLTLLVLGASGDLTARLLLPGLGQLLTSGWGVCG